MRKITPEKVNDYAIGGGPRGAGLKHKSKPMYPKISIAHKHLPEAEGAVPGSMHKVSMLLKMVGNRQNENEDNYDNQGEYEIHGIEHHGVGKKGKHHKAEKELEDGKQDEPETDEEAEAEGREA